MNTIKTDDGAEVYTDQILALCDEYISTLESDEPEKLMTRPPAFRGMLKYIYLNLFKPADKRGYNNRQCNDLDYSDIQLLDDIWNTYSQLCSKYLQNPTLLNFSLMTGISMDTFDSWRREGRGGSREHSRTLKRWYSECESAALDSAVHGNPGGMFVLKACFGYSEQPQRIELVEGSGAPQVSMAELEKLRESHLIAPEKPEI